MDKKKNLEMANQITAFWKLHKDFTGKCIFNAGDLNFRKTVAGAKTN